MEKIPKEAIDFLNELIKNNNRDWFETHKPDFKKLQKQMKVFNEAVFETLKDYDEIDSYKMFRIYRDVRFSKNKLPYKTNFGSSFHRLKPALRGGYYLHIEPHKSFIATGFWSPEKDDLFRIRKELEVDAAELRAILKNEEIQKVWGTLEGEELKTAPKGFDKEHPAIDLIRKKQFMFTKSFTNDEVLSANFMDEVIFSFKVIRPYFDYMSAVLTTNLNGESII